MRVVDLLCPEHSWCPLLTLLDTDREPRFQRPDRPAHAYAQTTRHDDAWYAQFNRRARLAARLQDNAARSDSHSGRAA
jgi:hypothetical protein